MEALRFLFVPSGRLRSQPFVLAAIGVYVAGFAAQALTLPEMLVYGLLPFAIVQAVLIWIWFALHAKRLHDSGHYSGCALVVSALYALSVALLLSVGASLARGFIVPAAQGSFNTSTLDIINVILVNDILYGFSMLQGTLRAYDPSFLGLNVMAFLPPAVAVTLTIWAAKQPSAAERKA